MDLTYKQIILRSVDLILLGYPKYVGYRAEGEGGGEGSALQPKRWVRLAFGSMNESCLSS